MIAKKFKVLKTLGQGAMGEVYLVLPPRGEPLALKLLKIMEGKNSQSAIEQFENEFKVLKKLSHPHIAKINDYGFDDQTKKIYFTSPWLKGSDLFEASKDADFSTCENYIVQMLRAINYLHQKGIIHCDLKPGNVFVEDGKILLIDFGLAGYWGESIAGTPTYLSPEIFRGGHHNIASDLYAVGIIFYNVFCRTQPFSGKNIQEIYDRHRSYTPPPISQINPHVPKYISDIALTLLSKREDQRYQSAAAVIEEISEYSSTKYSVETKETLLSYLPKTSEIIGRQEAQWEIEKNVGQFLSVNSKKPYMGIYIHGENGVGKSKFIATIKTRLQLEKIAVEEVVLPLNEVDKEVLTNAKVIILEDIDNFLEQEEITKDKLENLEIPRALQEFLTFLEQKILSPNTTRFLLIVTGDQKEYWSLFENLFPSENLVSVVQEISVFNQEEAKFFLEIIIGQKQIPEEFVSEVFRNTGGNPGIIQQIIENLIQKGLLFDESGRWSSDLLAHLSEAFKKLETPASLEEKIKHEYNLLPPNEKEIVHWLAMAPHGLTKRQFRKLLHRLWIGGLLRKMKKKRLLRTEESQRYFLYKSAFISFLKKNLDQKFQKELHDQLSNPQIGLEQHQIWYHHSWGSNRHLAKESLEKLAEYLNQTSRREGALESYLRLQADNQDATLQQRLDWAIKIAEVYIWLDRFNESIEQLSKIENEIAQGCETVPLQKRLLLWEKKGLSLLHQRQVKEASFYFSEGARLSSTTKGCEVEEARFLNDLAQIDVMSGRIKESIPKFAKSREKSSLLTKEQKQRITNNDLGHIHYQIGNFDIAVELLLEDIQVFKSLPQKEPLARAIYSLAECYRAQKRTQESVEQYEKCIEISQKDNLLPILLRAYNGLGNIYLVGGDFEKALTNYQKGINISVHLKDPITKAALLVNQGLIYYNQRNWPQAQRRFLLSKQIMENKVRTMSYENQLLAKCYQALASIAVEEADPMKAISFKEDYLKSMMSAKEPEEKIFEAKMELAQLYLDNRLEDPLKAYVAQLKDMAKSEEQKTKLNELIEKVKLIQNIGREDTMQVDLSIRS